MAKKRYFCLNEECKKEMPEQTTLPKNQSPILIARYFTASNVKRWVKLGRPWIDDSALRSELIKLVG